jgi:succinoglycan biosynthesis protein ExoV
MRLFYCAHLPNFGDQLNSWLWPRVLPEHLNSHSDTVLVGIGTLLNEGMMPWANKLVLGAGVPDSTSWHQHKVGTWHIYGVRGPLTAQALRLDARYALSDPAVLVPLLRTKAPATMGAQIGFMPHHLSARLGDWRAVCDQAGLRYIDPGTAIEDVLQAISGVRMLITEALHGAIVADALRVPWLPVQAYTHINRFKWQDWAASLNVRYEPQYLPPLWDGVKNIKPYAGVRLAIKRTAAQLGWWHPRWRPLHPLHSTEAERDFVASRLTSLATGHAPPALSKAQALEDAQARLLAAIKRMKQEWPTRAQSGKSVASSCAVVLPTANVVLQYSHD